VLSLAGAVLLAAALPAAARGQAFAFSVGSGGGYHHHHHHGWWAGYSVGPWWGPGWYGPPAVVYAPPPVVQERVVVVQPQTPGVTVPPVVSPYSTSSTGSMPGGSPATTTLAANSLAPVSGGTDADDRIVIRNASGLNLPVSFLVDGQDVELADGVTRTFVGKSRRVVQYDRGGRYGSTQQDLTGGQYDFRITPSGWDLVRKADIVMPGRTAVRANSLPGGVSR
jgi:hypothetical protein